MINVASEEVNKSLLEQVVTEETNTIAHQVYKEERNNSLLLLTEKFFTFKKRSLFLKLVVYLPCIVTLFFV